MKAEKTIRKMLKEYRTIFKTKADCLNHLFCTIGNGYDWKNGELVDAYCGKEYRRDKEVSRLLYDSALFLLRRDPTNERHKQNVEDYGPDELSKEVIEERMANTFLYKFNEPTEWYSDGKKNSIPRTWYPLAEEFSYIYNIPKDIKSDWLEVAREVVQLLKRDKIKLNEKKLDKRLL